MKEDNYITVIESIKERIKESQHRALLSVNKQLIILYWNVGRIIYENSVWGNKFLSNLAREINIEFPGLKGFSVRNLKNMTRFYKSYPELEFVQAVSAQIPWSHNLEILRVSNNE